MKNENLTTKGEHMEKILKYFNTTTLPKANKQLEQEIKTSWDMLNIFGDSYNEYIKNFKNLNQFIKGLKDMRLWDNDIDNQISVECESGILPLELVKTLYNIFTK